MFCRGIILVSLRKSVHVSAPFPLEDLLPIENKAIALSYPSLQGVEEE